MEDERLTKINQEKQNAINESNNTYNKLLQDNQNLYNQQQDYVNKYEQNQNEALDKQLALNEEKINQQKEIARQNNEVEQKKAKNDYMAFVNPYGYQAESLASNGLLNTGVSETSKLGAFNAQQNRLAAANKSMQDAFLQYDNDIKEARLSNDVQKAQNAINKLQMQLQYSESFYKNNSSLILDRFSKNQELDNNYYNRYQTEYGNIQNEKQRAEQIRQWEAEIAEQKRQYDANMAYKKEQDRIAQQQWEKEYVLNKSRTYSSNYGSRSNSNSSNTSNIPLTSNYVDTGYTIDAGGTTTSLLEKDGKYYRKSGDKYIDMSNMIANLNDDFMTLSDGTVIIK